MSIKLLDGAMGTEMQKMGLKPGETPELWNVTNPEKIAAIHRSYLEAGTDILYSCTFGANRKKLARDGVSVDTIIKAAIANARAAIKESGKSAQVALDIGPIGALLEPLGDLKFEDAYDIFAEMMEAGKDADVVVIETMTDLYETKAAVLAAKEHTDLPIYVTMSFEANKRTFTGTSLASMALTLEGLGVDAVGFNCSLGPAELAPMVKELYSLTGLPIIFKPNAGLPDPMTNTYNVDPVEFGELLKELLPYGIAYLGGCCGTAPDYIRETKKVVTEFEDAVASGAFSYSDEWKELTEKREHRVSGICCSQNAVYMTEPRVIGERINPTGKKRFKEALLNNDMGYILEQAISQVDAGADILDVNVGLPGVDEKEMMVRVIKELQAVVSVPLQIDSNIPEVVEAALRIYNGKPIVNSVNGEAKSRASILPLVKKYGASVVGLTLDENGIPKKAEERFAIAETILSDAKALGIPSRDVFIDCLTLTASAEQKAVVETLNAMTMVRDRLGLNCVLGVSNISFGLPYRDLVNDTFLTLALHCGLTLPIMNPNSEAMMGALRAYRVLKNFDEHCVAYTDAYKDYKPLPAGAAALANAALAANLAPSGATNSAASGSNEPAANDPASRLKQAILRGLTTEGERLTSEALASGIDPMTLVNESLIPALDEVGMGFEKGSIYLPQLMTSAATVQGAFSKIKEHLAKDGSEQVNKGTIVLATVKGDVHDIGKNIVKVLWENYGFRVIDLGKDVDPKEVVKAATEHRVKLVGLSALMTTTLVSMKETIDALHEAGLPCQVVVGGAVLTPEYAMEMGADFYAKDAKESVDIAKKVFGV